MRLSLLVLILLTVMVSGVRWARDGTTTSSRVDKARYTLIPEINFGGKPLDPAASEMAKIFARVLQNEPDGAGEAPPDPLALKEDVLDPSYCASQAAKLASMKTEALQKITFVVQELNRQISPSQPSGGTAATTAAISGAGASGASGASGPDGEGGASGASGEASSSGASGGASGGGASGASGEEGATGASGASGAPEALLERDARVSETSMMRSRLRAMKHLAKALIMGGCTKDPDSEAAGLIAGIPLED